MKSDIVKIGFAYFNLSQIAFARFQEERVSAPHTIPASLIVTYSGGAVGHHSDEEAKQLKAKIEEFLVA